MNNPEQIYSELPAIDLFRILGYQYSNGLEFNERSDITEIVLKQRLSKAIQRINPWINPANLKKAVDTITEIHAASLMEANQHIWELIRGSEFTVKQVISGKEEFKPVWFIDYRNPENNDFLVVNQMKFHGRYQHSVPDLTVYLNGLPVAVIECKSPSSPSALDKAVNDLLYYQENSEKLFYYNQICAGIYEVSGRYGAIGAGKTHYSLYNTKDNHDLAELTGKQPTNQDILIYNLFRKDKMLDLIRHFVIFELEENRTVKKLPRYIQIRATNKAIEKLQKDKKGGVIWHTQGSGKSLTMAYITRKLQAEEFGFDNPTVLIMTDRKDLDTQITQTFHATGFKNVSQASSVVHLDKLLRNDYGGIITTTLQKFQEQDPKKEDTEDLTDQEETENRLIEKSVKDGMLIKITKMLVDGKWVEKEREEIILEELSKKENLYVLADEAHRSHYGFLAALMRSVLPNAKFLAFTGTPISKEDKSTLGEFYGGDYIDTYTIKESVQDGNTVELLYDEGIARLIVKKKELDEKFKKEFGYQSREKQEKLKQEALKKYQLSADRIEKICYHILEHYQSKIYPDGHKAMIVTEGQPAALRYKKTLEKLREKGVHNFQSKLVISLGPAKSNNIAKNFYKTLKHNRENPKDQKPLYIVPPEKVKDVIEDFKLPFGDESVKEKSGKKKFNNDAFMIVSDMLLTGYDVPVASCMYLDKPLKEHNLLQAIARVNRTRKGKHAGYIIDYYGITDYLIQALEIFSGDIRPDDILKNLNEEIPRLERFHAKLTAFFNSIKIDRNYERKKFIDEAVRFIEPIHLRDKFKVLLADFNKSINIVLPNVVALKYEYDFKLFNEIRLRARNLYPEDEELKITQDESRKIQALIDEHVKSEGVENLLEEPVSVIDKDKFKQDMIEASATTKELKMRNNLKHTIKVGLDKNPDFYKPLAQRLEDLIKARDDNRITQLELLKAYSEIQEVIINENKEGREKGFTRESDIAVFYTMKALYGDKAESITKEIFEQIQGELNIVEWQQKGMVKKDMENKIAKVLKEHMKNADARQKAKEVVELIRVNS